MLRKYVKIILIVLLIISTLSFNPKISSSNEPEKGNPIILIPGITGTELFSNDRKRIIDMVFPISSSSNLFNQLHINNHLVEGDLIGWSGSITDNRVKQIYGSLEKSLENYNVYPFPYDWRYSNEHTANKLQKFINEVLQTEGVQKVDIIAHSMGGIIAKEYILNSKGESVDQFISLGTPYFGSPSSFTALKDGLFHGLLAKRSTVRSLPSIYELLPSRAYFEKNETTYVGERVLRAGRVISETPWSYDITANYIMDNFGIENFQNAERLHNKIDDEKIGELVHFYRIIGDTIPTVGYIYQEKYDISHFTGRDKTRWVTADVNGDGTVPLSGTGYGSNNTWYFPSSHTDLVYWNGIHNALDLILNGRDPYPILRKKPNAGSKKLKISIYNATDSLFQMSQINEASLSTNQNFSEDNYLNNNFDPSIKLISNNGERIVYENGQVISNPFNYDIRFLGSTLEFIVDPEEFQLVISSNESTEKIGLLVSSYENGNTTKTLDYQEMELSSGRVLANITGDILQSKVGIDTNHNGNIDVYTNPLDTEPANISFKEYDYDSGSPIPEIPIPPDDDSPDPQIDITITGTQGTNNWFTSDINISISTSIEIPIEEPEEGEGNEEEGEPPAELEPKEPIISYALNDGGEKGYSEIITVNQDGYHTLSVLIRDDEGSLLGQATESFKIDKTKPELMTQVAAAHGENGWLISDAQISIGATEETSKLARVDYSYNSRGLQGYTGYFNETNEGYHEVSAEAEDNAGNIQTITTPFKIDKTKPVIADVYLQDEYYWGEDFPISFTTHDDISGVASLTATINGKPVTNGSTYLFTEPGWHTYRIEVKDYAGWKAVYETEFEVYIPANISFRPKHLMLDHGEPGMATTYIQLPYPFPLDDLIHSSIELNEHNIHIQDQHYGFVRNPIGFDEEEIDLEKNEYYMIKYNRGSLIDVVEPMDIMHSPGNPNAPDWSNTTIALFGKWGEFHFKGYDSFIVTNKRYNPPPDVTKPELESQPAHNQTNVSVEVTPIITFSEPVVLGNGIEVTDLTVKGQIQIRDSQGRPVVFTANWMKNTPAIQFNPSLLLLSNETYQITIGEGAFTDLAGNRNDAFTVSFTTENSPIIISPPLPVPIIENESGAPGQEPVTQDPSPPRYSEPEFNAPITQQQIQLDDSTTQINDTELDQEIRLASSDIITLSAGENKTKIGLSRKHLKKIIEADKNVQLKINGVAFTISPRDFLLEENTESYVIFSAEVLSDDEKDKVLNKATNKERFLVLGNEVLHLSVSLLNKEQEKAVDKFNAKIIVSIQLPKEAAYAARNGRLWMGRLNPDSNVLEKYTGNYNELTGTFEFETDQFSNWTYLVEKQTFQDVGIHWAKEDIEYMANLGYINGLDNLNFAPNNNMTRGQFAKVLAEILNLRETSKLPFIDVTESQWYYDSVNKVYTSGIVNGMDAQTFAPSEVITREQMAVMIVNALNYLEKDLTTIETEVPEGLDEVSTWAKEAVKTLIKAGLVKGKKKGNNTTHIAPKDYLTRAEGITLLRILLNN